MANGPDHDQVPHSSPPLPGGDDLSAFDSDLAAPGFVVGSDDEALRKINRRTSTFGRIAAVLLVGSAAVIGFLAWQSAQKAAEQEAKFNALAEIEDKAQLLAELRALLPEVSDDDLQWRIIMNLGHHRDAESMPLFIAALDDAGKIRRAAAWAIGRVGLPAAEPAKAKLLEVLPDTDEKDRAQVVWTLAMLRESTAADAIIEQFKGGFLQNVEGFDPKIIVEVLGPARVASDELMQHESESVRVLVAQALAEAASPDVVDPLTRLLRAETSRGGDNQSQEVIRSSVAGLGRTGDRRAAEPLFELVQKQPNQRQAVVDALRKSTAAPQVAVLANQAQDASVKRDLVRLVAESHDTRVADTLAQWLGSDDEEIKIASAYALAELGDRRSADTLLELARSEDDGTAERALQLLKDIVQPQHAATIAAMVDEFPFRKATLMRVLGRTGDVNVARRKLEAELAGDDAPSAAMALADLGSADSYRKLLDMAKRPANVDMTAPTAAERSLTNEDLLRKRKGAILALGRFGNPEAFAVLSTIVEDQMDDYELRALAAASIGQSATAEQIADVLRKVNDQGINEPARRYYVQALWQRPHPEINRQLLDVMRGNAPSEVKRAVALAIGYSGDASMDAPLMEMLDNEATRRDAAFAVLLGGSDAAARKLVQILRQDADVREILQMTLMAEDNDWFNLLTEQMFESGQVWRRITVSKILADGDRNQSFGYAMAKTVAVLRSGWEGTNGVNSQFVRQKMWEALKGNDAAKRDLALQILMAIPERGLLLRARDEGGAAGEIARQALRAGEAPRPDGE